MGLNKFSSKNEFINAKIQQIQFCHSTIMSVFLLLNSIKLTNGAQKRQIIRCRNSHKWVLRKGHSNKTQWVILPLKGSYSKQKPIHLEISYLLSTKLKKNITLLPRNLILFHPQSVMFTWNLNLNFTFKMPFQSQNSPKYSSSKHIKPT